MQQQQRNRTEKIRRPIYKITIETEEGVHNRIEHRARDTTTREKQPNSTGPIRQRHGQKEHVWPRQTTEVKKGPTELKSSPRLTGRSKQHRPTYNNNRQHDRHGDRPCY